MWLPKIAKQSLTDVKCFPNVYILIDDKYKIK